jgi:hypothetical protein
MFLQDGNIEIHLKTVGPWAPAWVHAGTAEKIRKRTAELAYRRAEQRGFGPGEEWDDWLQAEREVLAALND